MSEVVDVIVVSSSPDAISATLPITSGSRVPRLATIRPDSGDATSIAPAIGNV